MSDQILKKQIFGYARFSESAQRLYKRSGIPPAVCIGDLPQRVFPGGSKQLPDLGPRDHRSGQLQVRRLIEKAQSVAHRMMRPLSHDSVSLVVEDESFQTADLPHAPFDYRLSDRMDLKALTA